MTVSASFKMFPKEVQKVYRLFLVNHYVLQGNIQSEKEADIDKSISYLHGRFSDSLKELDSTSESMYHLNFLNISLQ